MNEKGEFLWPGFGDNLRVLEWILKRAFDEVDACETEIGYLPFVDDINLTGTDITTETMEELLRIDRELWREEIANVQEFYGKFNGKVPGALREELRELERRLTDHT